MQNKKKNLKGQTCLNYQNFLVIWNKGSFKNNVTFLLEKDSTMWENEELGGRIMRYRPFIGLNIALGGSDWKFLPSGTWSVADVKLLISLLKNQGK